MGSKIYTMFHICVFFFGEFRNKVVFTLNKMNISCKSDCSIYINKTHERWTSDCTTFSHIDSYEINKTETCPWTHIFHLGHSFVLICMFVHFPPQISVFTHLPKVLLPFLCRLAWKISLLKLAWKRCSRQILSSLWYQNHFLQRNGQTFLGEWVTTI